MIKKGSIVRRASGASLQERLAFYSIPEPNSGCQLWLGSVDGKGYGQLRFGGRNQPAHRLAWVVANGSVPDGHGVLHKCDTRGCINPAHLWTGTHTDNMRDMADKGRHGLSGLALGWLPGPRARSNQARGEKVHGAKLTEADVRAIRADRRVYRVIAIDYGISLYTVKDIRRRRSWKHVQ